MVQYDISVYDANQKKLCTQLDTTYATEGEQSDVSISQEMSGWKELTFDIPWVVGKEKNFRMDFLKNENTIRVIRNSDVSGTYEDWFLIREPEDAHSGKTKELTVSCEHISSELKTKNLYVYFDDTNGIDTIGNLISKALHGSGWTQGLCDTLYEADGTTEKVRSYSCDEKTGAYNMVTGICDLFMAYPTFNGANKTVDIHAISNKTGNVEFNYGKNIDSLHRSPNSTDIVTRLYVEGDYSDLGYVGIEDVNPTGLGCIMNFDYYKEVGAFTDTHQAALDTYIETAKQQKTQIETTSASMLDKETRLSEIWGTGKYVLYSVSNGQATAQYLGNGAEQDDAAFKEDDLVVAVKNGGEYSYVTASAGMTFGTDIVYAVKFLTPSAGQIGGKEVAIEAKETTIETLTEAKEEADSEKEKTELQNQINTTQQEINNLKNGTTESEGSYALMWEAVTTVLEIKTLDATVKSAQEDMAEAEQTFVDAMGNMLHDGYWNNSNYTVGQEESLYADAVEILKIMSRPAVTYSMSFLNLAALSDYKMEEIKLNMRVRIYDFELGINDWGFVEKLVEYPLAERENTVTISTDELNIGANTFESVLNRMMEAANIIDQRNAIYERAAAISEGGTISADQLNGEIDLLKNHLASTKSGWYTDANGNIMFEAQDGQSAMMLSGSGFMVANGKDASGNWNWRTFGTGEGFTADLITAGILRAGTITILGTDQFYWDADNIYIFDPSNPDRQIRIGKYDGTNYGIGYTTDNGVTWQNAIGFDGVSLSASMTETINSLGDRVTEVESKVTPDAIVQTVTESETYQNEIGGLDQRISTAESKLTPEAMETTIENSEALSEVRQTADKINWIVESGTSSSNMTLTDDALNVISEGITLTADKINLVADDINLTGNTSVNTIVSNATDELETQIQQNTNNITIIASETNKATPYISDTPPEAPIEDGKLWIDTGVEPDVWRFWRGADVTTEREYTETRVGCGKNLLPIRTTDDTLTGISYHSNGDGTYTVNGTSTGNAAYILLQTVIPPGNYVLSGGSNNVNVHVAEFNADGTWVSSIAMSVNGNAAAVTIQPLPAGHYHRINIGVDLGLQASSVTVYPQLEVGSTVTAFEPYQDIPFLALDNAQGQIESVAVEAGCRAQQTGDGQRRNLLKNTQAFTGVNGESELTGETYNGFAIRSGSSANISSDYVDFAQWDDAVDAELGKTYTFSFWAKGSGKLYAYFYRGNDNQPIVVTSISSQGESDTRRDGQIFFTLSGDWERYWVKWTISGTGDMTEPKKAILLRLYKTDSATASVCGAQLEEGSVATDWTPGPGDYAPIAGRDSVEIAACGKNLLKLSEMDAQTINGVTFKVNANGSVTVNGTASATSHAVFVPIESDESLRSRLLNKQITLSGTPTQSNAYLQIYNYDEVGGFIFDEGNGGTGVFSNASSGFNLAIVVRRGNTVDNLIFWPQIEEGATATAFEPYRSMGGGTVTPTEPLYGLPGAEDTVEVSVDGDVTVTRRTAVLELDGTENWILTENASHDVHRFDTSGITPAPNRPGSNSIVPAYLCSHYVFLSANATWSGEQGVSLADNASTLHICDMRYDTVDDFKAYLAAQKTAGTPVTIVYELAAPETEALTAISPIAPQPGQLNLFTDADALTATIHGSGWETVNDTSSIQDALANLDGDLASLINEVGLLNGEVGSIAQQIISPDGIKNIVFESSEYQAMANTVEQNANELSVTQTTVTDINGRVETIEGTVRISGSNIDIGRSDSNVQLHLDNEGWSISEGGQETIYARQNRVVAPRFQTTSLIFGALAFNSSGGHFRLMKYGG